MAPSGDAWPAPSRNTAKHAGDVPAQTPLPTEPAMIATLADHIEQIAATAAAAQRYDMYEPIHKGLRDFMGDTLSRIGRVDVFDVQDMARTLAQLEALLNFCFKHLSHENEFLHVAIRARQPGAGS